MLEQTIAIQLANDDGVFARTQARFVDKGRGRIPLWRGSFQLTDIALTPGGTYQVILPSGQSCDFVVDSCEALGENKCIVSFTVPENLAEVL